MANADFITEEVERFFSKELVSLVSDFDLSKLDPINHVIQVRDAKNLAPKEQAKRYAEQMAHTVFPPIVVTRNGYIVDGNTRVRGNALRKVFVFPAYVIDVDYGRGDEVNDQKLRALAATLNSANGNPLTPAEMRRAIRNFLGFGYKTEKITKYLGASSTTISSVRRQVEAERKLEKVGLKPADYSSETQRQALGNVEVVGLNDEPYKELAKLVLEADLKPAEISTLGKAARAAGSDEKAKAVIAAARDENRERIGRVSLTGKGSPSASAQFRKVLGGITKFDERERDLLEADPALAENYVASINKAIAILTHLRDLQAA